MFLSTGSVRRECLFSLRVLSLRKESEIACKIRTVFLRFPVLLLTRETCLGSIRYLGVNNRQFVTLSTDLLCFLCPVSSCIPTMIRVSKLETGIFACLFFWIIHLLIVDSIRKHNSLFVLSFIVPNHPSLPHFLPFPSSYVRSGEKWFFRVLSDR